MDAAQPTSSKTNETQHISDEEGPLSATLDKSLKQISEPVKAAYKTLKFTLSVSLKNLIVFVKFGFKPVTAPESAANLANDLLGLCLLLQRSHELISDRKTKIHITEILNVLS